ncbi:MAG: DNA modification methylase [Acidobacteria bacterium 13_1_20CM_3_53_8]|nr:MAG: DNA modification methylase [Acidobacteria bacterium 13_1_20CM_3_53_8]
MKELGTNSAITSCFYRNIRESGFRYEEVNIGDITFKPGQNESVHRWYRLTPSYSPGLVRYLIQELAVTKDSFVLDPFCGRGTTIIECQKLGIPALGIEINPLLQQVSDRSLLWETGHLKLFGDYIAELDCLLNEHQKDSIDSVLLKFNARLPLIHNVFRWWKPDVLKNLIICRELSLLGKYSSISNYLWLAVNKAALDCANIHRNHPTITFDDNHQRNIDVYFEVSENLKTISKDLESLSDEEICNSRLNSVLLGNSTRNLEELLKRSVGLVITSPPYPNRYSYVHQTRPQLHFMDLLENIRQATEIDLNAIGGTWGRATSILQNELIEVPAEIRPYLSYYDELKDRSVLMCNYATKYFIDLWRHIKALKRCVSNDFKGAYVVGNSRLSGVEIFTEAIFGKICEREGFRVEKIISFRKRGGRQRLYETAVCIKRQK